MKKKCPLCGVSVQYPWQGHEASCELVKEWVEYAKTHVFYCECCGVAKTMNAGHWCPECEKYLKDYEDSH